MTDKQKQARTKLLAKNKAEAFYRKNRLTIERKELIHVWDPEHSKSTLCGLLVMGPMVIGGIPTCTICALRMMRTNDPE